MRNPFVVSLLGLSVLATVGSCVAFDRDGDTAGQDSTDTDRPAAVYAPFLQPLRLELDVVRHFPTPLPRIGVPTTVGPGNLPNGGVDSGIGNLTTGSPPHLQVAFHLISLEHQAVANGGAVQNMNIKWWTHSSVATWESDWDPSSYIPDPGSSLFFDAPFYVGEVANGCGNVPVFPVEFVSEVYFAENVFGDFSATDNDTLQPNGYWNFAYAIRVVDDAGGTSDIRVSGIVSAYCVW